MAAHNLAGLIIDLPADQIVSMTGYIAHRAGTTHDTVAEAVIAHLERAPGANRRGDT